MNFEKHSYKLSADKTGNMSPGMIRGYRDREPVSDEEKVLKEISKILGAVKRRIPVIIGVAAICTAGLLLKLSQKPPSFTGSFQLLVEPVTSAESRLQSILTQTEGSQRETLNTKDFTLDYGTLLRVLKSPKVMSPIYHSIIEEYPKYNPTKLIVQRPFNESEGTRIIEVGYSGKTENEVQFVLEKVVEGYLEYKKTDRQTNLRRGIIFIEEQIPELQDRVNNLQKQIRKLREQYDVMIPEVLGSKFQDQQRAVEMRQLEIDLNLTEAKAAYSTVKTLFEQENYVAILGQEAGTYGSFVVQVQNTEIELKEASARLEAEHPTIKVLREKQQELEIIARKKAQSILDKLASNIQVLEENQQTLAQAEIDLKQRLEVLPAVASRYDDLQRELKLATESLNKNLAKLDGLRIDAAQQEVPWELIAPPSTEQVAGVTRKIQILTGIVGLLLGIGAGVALELLNNVFHTPDDLEEDTKLPLLGVIPLSKELKKLSTQVNVASNNLVLVGAISGSPERLLQTKLYNSSPVVEAFRSLYTNIRLLSPEMPFQSLVIGAATPKEGKSTVAINFAKTAAAIGQRVLLVDADMRQPKIHQKLDLVNLRGLSDTISTDISLNDAIQRSPENDNLFVLTAGPVPEDPIKLLSSKKMHSLMEQFQDFFDLVIYDTPPLMGLADASILAAKTDGLILVVKIDKTDRSLVTKALDRLKISGASVLGVVANGIKS